MPRICYVPRRFSGESHATIEQANRIFAEYQSAGFVLTLRQLYYQFVSRDLLANNMQSYKRLGSVINDARLAGMVDWELMEDRTRSLKSQPAWQDAPSIVAACAAQFRIDKWNGQPMRPEVWIEKDALAGVFERVCHELQVPYFSCRGYTSQSEMWVAGQRLRGYKQNGRQTPIIFHFGDHDPSGIDMTRDIEDRLNLFGAGGVCVVDLRRLALNMDQVDQYGPPPNPAKITDSRAEGYIKRFGHESWELDALQPEVLSSLVRDSVLSVRDNALWEEALKREEAHKKELKSVSDDWFKIIKKLRTP